MEIDEKGHLDSDENNEEERETTFAEYNEESNEKDPKFKISDHVRISNYKNIFAKGYTPNWSKEVL